MKAAGALPTEERVQKMSNIQWIWYYKNLIKDEEESESLMKSRIDYLAFFVNPELHKSVMDIKSGDFYKDSTVKKSPIKKGDVYVNDSFEEELKAAMEGQDLTVLPDSQSAGNANMSQDDFLRMAEQMQQFMGMPNVQNQPHNLDETIDEEKENNTLNENDLDYFDENDLDYFE